MRNGNKTDIQGAFLPDPGERWKKKGCYTIHDVPHGAQALVIADAARSRGGIVIHIARDAGRAATLCRALNFFAPDLAVIDYPAWECLPYDRISPSASATASRVSALSSILHADRKGGTLVVSTTVNAAIQRTPPLSLISSSTISFVQGKSCSMEEIETCLSVNGFRRTPTVREHGEFSIRGGLIDIFTPCSDTPVRLDFFGDTLESIRLFDAVTQRTTGRLDRFDIVPAGELVLKKENISRFRREYIKAFGPANADPLYESVSAGRLCNGAEHWLPLFYEETGTLFSSAGKALLFMDDLVDEAVRMRFSQINDYYTSRKESNTPGAAGRKGISAGHVYRPLPPDALYMSPDEWESACREKSTGFLSPYPVPSGKNSFSAGFRTGRNFVPERASGEGSVFDAVVEHALTLKNRGMTPVMTCWSAGSADRMRTVLEDHGGIKILHSGNFTDVCKHPSRLQTVVAGLETGFETDRFAFLTEQDILGDRIVRSVRKRKRPDNFLKEASGLSEGDLVVHVDHGIGRYDGLRTLEVRDAPHDCLCIVYHGGDRLFLPVENIDLVSRFGPENAGQSLDRLGSASWQARKSKIRNRIKMLGEQLIAIAAKREMHKAPVMDIQNISFDEFCARFPFSETEDQENAIHHVIDDLSKGRPMDRLVCGDTGFGKTEVALRAAFIAAMNGFQVAVIAPTTLLVRQHYENFSLRFEGFPVRVAQLSRMISQKEGSLVRKGLRDGTIDIVIGTHALLSKNTVFSNPGLVIVDEEQHFGVKHKERLKEFRAGTHILTLTATPIPRTLQLAMSGIRDLSLIATPPVDRLAVRTTTGPFDPVVAREILLREHYRGGQSFYVVPRISDLDDIREFLDTYVTEVKYAVAHGGMNAGQLEDIITAFYEGRYDVLVSTTIIESGLDIPSANTILVHHADMFGLSQLYQLRGRVGRSKQRAYAYLTTRPEKLLTSGAENRLKVMQSLDTLGAGFTLASHDMDIRGAGNLLGEEQSGQIREVGAELYQQMLEEAVSRLRGGETDIEENRSPGINIGTSVLIPEEYVEDLDVRMALYRRLGSITSPEEIDAFAAELVDRFGPLPPPVEHLLQVVSIKGICRRAGISKIDAGIKGAVISFHNDSFCNVAGLVEFSGNSPYDVKLRPDHKFVYRANWPDETARLKGARKIAGIIADIAEEKDHDPCPVQAGMR